MEEWTCDRRPGQSSSIQRSSTDMFTTLEYQALRGPYQGNQKHLNSFTRIQQSRLEAETVERHHLERNLSPRCHQSIHHNVCESLALETNPFSFTLIHIQVPQHWQSSSNSSGWRAHFSRDVCSWLRKTAWQFSTPDQTWRSSAQTRMRATF